MKDLIIELTDDFFEIMKQNDRKKFDSVLVAYDGDEVSFWEDCEEELMNHGKLPYAICYLEWVAETNADLREKANALIEKLKVFEE